MFDFSYQLTQNTTVENTSLGLEVAVDRRKRVFPTPCALESEILSRLQQPPLTGQQISEAMGISDNPVEQARIYYLINQLDGLGALGRHIVIDGGSIAALIPNSGALDRPSKAPASGAVYRLSRFVTVQPAGSFWHVSSPLGNCRFEARHADILGAVMDLIKGISYEDFVERVSFGPEVGKQILALLLWARLIDTENDKGELEEDQDLSLVHWEPHDLYFHSRSRMGRHVGDFGGTFRFASKVPEIPALPDAPPVDFISLPVPDLSALEQNDGSFQAVLEKRQSSRDFHNSPLTKAALGEVLYRSLRMKERRRKGDMEVAFYPYPGGGARSELSAYLVVSGVDGLQAGLYRYDAERHGLWHLTELTEDVSHLLTDACSALQADRPPPVLIVLSARFRRMSWKYQGMSYAVTLKNVGCVMQTLYLSCAAMGLSGCAVGAGDADRFARCTGHAYTEEGSVGEFALGGAVDAAS